MEKKMGKNRRGWVNVLSGLLATLVGLLVALCFVYLFFGAGNLLGPHEFAVAAVPAILIGVIVAAGIHFLFNRRLFHYVGDPLIEADRQIDSLDEKLRQSNCDLEANNRQMQSILENLQDGIIATAEDGRVIVMTDRAGELLGPHLPARYLSSLGSNYAGLAELQDVYTRRELKQTSILSKPVVDQTNPNQEGQEGRGDKSAAFKLILDFAVSYPQARLLQVTISSLPLAREKQGILYVISDVTRIRQLETIRSEFVSNVTHELKTPLTSIQGYLELLRSAPRDSETRGQFYEIMSIETDRLKSLVSDLLSLSEIEQSQNRDRPTKPVYLRQVVEGVLAGLKPQIEAKKLQVKNRLPSDLTFSADELRLEQLFSNLLSNAVKYNIEEGEVEVRSNLARNRLELVVSDTGRGIPHEDQERIFERFYRVNKSRSREVEGTGLGLSIVKHIVNLYDGSIQIESEPSRGTSFIILFPLV